MYLKLHELNFIVNGFLGTSHVRLPALRRDIEDPKVDNLKQAKVANALFFRPVQVDFVVFLL